MKKILIITYELTILNNYPVGGRGFRLHNLAEGLEKNNFKVYFSFLKENVNKINKGNIDEDLLKYSHNFYYDDIINEIKPDAIIFSPWDLALHLKNKEILKSTPIIIDEPGPIVLENIFEKRLKNLEISAQKLAALNKADIIICSNKKQKVYMYPWLILSGLNLKENIIKIVPITISKKIPEINNKPENPIFIFGGVLWEWQNYGFSLDNIADYLETKEKGLLKIFAGNFIYKDKIKKLSFKKNYTSVKNNSLISYDEFVKECLNASVAIEIYEPNVERELAMTTRTLTYLWAGLPIIYSENMFFSDIIKKYDAGWIVPFNDKEKLFNVINEILLNPEICKIKGQNAQKIILEKFNNLNGVQPLVDYLNNPYKTKKQKNYYSYSGSTIFNQSELLLKKYDENNHLKNNIESLKKEINNKNNEINNKNNEINNKNNLINELKIKNEFLTEDLNRITSRFIFKLLLKIKKIFDSIMSRN